MRTKEIDRAFRSISNLYGDIPIMLNELKRGEALRFPHSSINVGNMPYLSAVAEVDKKMAYLVFTNSEADTPMGTYEAQTALSNISSEVIEAFATRKDFGGVVGPLTIPPNFDKLSKYGRQVYINSVYTVVGEKDGVRIAIIGGVGKEYISPS